MQELCGMLEKVLLRTLLRPPYVAATPIKNYSRCFIFLCFIYVFNMIICPNVGDQIDTKKLAPHLSINCPGPVFNMVIDHRR